MRVVLTVHFSPWSAYSGGGQRSTHSLALALGRRGHDVTVVYTKAPWERVQPPEPLPYETVWATLLAARSSSGALLRPLVPLSVAHRVLDLVRGRPDVVVHSQGEEAALLPALRRRHPFGLVVTPRFPSVPGLLSKEGRTLHESLWLHAGHSRYVLLGLALRGADYASPPSHYAGRLIARAYGLDEARVRPIHNGVPEEFLEHEWRPSRAPRPALFFGRLSRDKGIDTLMEAIRSLGSEAPALRVVGRGPDRPLAERLAASLGPRFRVEILPWADHHALGRLLSESSMAVLPSRQESLSLAVLSAMAVGTPLVATDVGGTAEVVRDGEEGLLVPAGDARALAGAMRRVLADPEWAAELGRRGREKVRRELTWDVAAERFEALYRSLLPIEGVEAGLP